MIQFDVPQRDRAVPLLTAEEEVELAKRIEASDEMARRRLAGAQPAISRCVAKRYGTGYAVSDSYSRG